MFKILKFAWQNFSRNFWLSLVTIFIILFALFLINLIITLSILVNQSINYYKNKIDVSVLLKPEMTDEQILVMKKKLSDRPEIKEMQFKPREQSMEELKNYYKYDPEFLEALKELDKNPLGETLIIKLRNIDDYPAVISLLQSDDFKNFIEKDFNKFEDIKKVINKLNNITQKIYQAEFIVSIIFSLVIFFIIFNTIRITIYNHREEIKVMRLVGASSWFIRGPFLAESIFYSFISWLINLIILFPLLKIIQPYITNFLDHYQFEIVPYFFFNNFFQIFGWQLLIIIFISILSSAMAMHKYLKA